jgi:hypothetical protein
MKSNMQIGSLSTVRLQNSLCSGVLLSVFLLAVSFLISCGGGGSSVLNPVAVTISPSAVTLFVGGAKTFTPAVTGTGNTAVTWTIQEGVAGGTITSAGVYAAPQAPGTYHVVATSVADNTKSAMATVTVPPVSVTVSPNMVSLGRGESLTFTATVTGSSNVSVTWSVQEGAAGGSITGTGVYMAPSTLGTFHVIATSQADDTKSGTAIVNVNQVSVTVYPASDILGRGGVRTFTTSVTGTMNTAVSWSVQEGSAGGTITNSGIYTAPTTTGTYHVIATSMADPSQNATATITVTESGFRLTGSMMTPRGSHTATLLLTTGKVLVAGGFNGTTCCSATSAELFDPTTEVFAATGSMSTERYGGHTATLLQNGKVLVAGGFSISSVAPTAELYDPVTGLFTPTGSMATGRHQHTATRLSNGTVLITGGFSGSTSVATAEIYDPDTGSFTSTGSMAEPRDAHTATLLLPSGKVLVAGGVNRSSGSYVVSATAELYDPATGSFTPIGSMTRVRVWHTATLLPNGKVLIAGEDPSAELYDPATGKFASTGSMTTVGILHAATLLPNGKVLAVSFNGTNAELYDPATGAFTPTGSMSTVRRWHAAALLANGSVLVVGGGEEDPDGGTLPSATAELYQ